MENTEEPETHCHVGSRGREYGVFNIVNIFFFFGACKRDLLKSHLLYCYCILLWIFEPQIEENPHQTR